ncbi:branched-chain amino acid ABC transporter permease [Brevibacterium samyangense]|uniref:Branched-chain amino acid ABC transporter permease n=1 Tax=Brevibacterium samyangense TaxID=366888 RepID=A0ABP5ETQ1_9MICO
MRKAGALSQVNITRGLVVLGALVLVLAPLLLSGSDYTLRLVTTAVVYAIAAYGMNIILGLTGQLSLAHAGFFGIGAYIVGILTVDHDWSFWAAFAVAILGTAVGGYLAGLLALRTKEEYFAIYTMAVGTVIYLVIGRWDAVTHAHSGIIGVKFPEGAGIVDFSSPVALYYLAVVFLVLVVYATWAIKRSTVGRNLMAIRTSEDLARSIGVNVGLGKQLAFAASTTVAGLAGGLYATTMGFLGPASASVNLTFEMLMFLLVGGMGTVFGPLIGSVLVVFLFELFQDFQSYRFLVLGPIIILLVIFAPRGIAGAWSALLGRLGGGRVGSATGTGASARVVRKAATAAGTPEGAEAPLASADTAPGQGAGASDGTDSADGVGSASADAPTEDTAPRAGASTRGGTS